MSSSSFNITRWVIIDDTNPRINYAIPREWSAQRATSNVQGTSGLPFNNTLHAAPASGLVQSFSFSFTGTSVAVYSVDNFLNISGAASPEVECVIDTINAHTTPPSFDGKAENNWELCSQYHMEDRQHTLTINSGSLNQTFLFDWIQYAPSLNASMENQTVYIENFDPDIVYGSGWAGLGMWYSFTSNPNATLDFEFTGISLQWYGVIPEFRSRVPTTATYTVDGGPAQVLNLTGPPDSSSNLENHQFFEISSLSMGKHKLSVVYNGDSTKAPLTLDYLVVQNGSLPYAPSPPNTDTPNTTHDTKHSNHIGPIVGGIFSGIFALGVILGLLFFYYRQRTTQREDDFTIFPLEVGLFDVQTNRGISPPSKAEQSDPTSGNHALTLRPQYRISRFFKRRQTQRQIEELPPPLTQVNNTILSPHVEVVRHQDSGLRALEDPQSTPEIVEMPPEYTPG
ncbi:hypothetical protein CPB83DRAFT_815375 [Crepidotus variabilis]|uniref:Transmembrane protein n=1 Tax=Crepidotus variabilis TaxID=179855 RepID=A0A9P6JPE2_9AGAR|nr:hypothetical protein CPB83DRAFT_815375 [Crepidotus variabilis]